MGANPATGAGLLAALGTGIPTVVGEPSGEVAEATTFGGAVTERFGNPPIELRRAARWFLRCVGEAAAELAQVFDELVVLAQRALDAADRRAGEVVVVVEVGAAGGDGGGKRGLELRDEAFVVHDARVAVFEVGGPLGRIPAGGSEAGLDVGLLEGGDGFVDECLLIGVGEFSHFTFRFGVVDGRRNGRHVAGLAGLQLDVTLVTRLEEVAGRTPAEVRIPPAHTRIGVVPEDGFHGVCSWSGGSRVRASAAPHVKCAGRGNWT